MGSVNTYIKNKIPLDESSPKKKSSRYTKKNIISNIFYILVNQGISKCISFFTVTIIIRTLGPYTFGEYSFCLAVIGYAGIFVNFGLSTYGSKQINQVSSKNEVVAIVSEILSLKLILAVVTYIPLLILYLLTDIKPLSALIILNIKSFADALNIQWYFKGILKNKYVVVATFLQYLTHLTIVLMLYKIFNLKIACISFVTSLMVLSISQLYILYKHESIRLNFSLLSSSQIRVIVSSAWPFFLSGLFSIILFNTDTIFLKIFTSSELVGYYNCAHRVIDLLSNLRYPLIGVFFPVFSQLFYLNPEKLLLRFFSSFKVIMTSIIVLTILIHFFAQEIILLLFGENYIPSIEILKYLIIATLLLYANTFISALYNSIGFEKKVLFSSLFAAIVNVILNSLLILNYQAVGAILATIISLLVSTCFLLLQFPKAIHKVSDNVAFKKYKSPSLI